MPREADASLRFRLVRMLDLPGLWISEAIGADISDLSEGMGIAICGCWGRGRGIRGQHVDHPE